MDYSKWCAEQAAERDAKYRAGCEHQQFVRSLGNSDDRKFVYCERPRCKVCGGTDLSTTRSIDNGDGSRTQSKRCRTCNHAFQVIWQ